MNSTTSCYYGGGAKDLGNVRKLNATSFEDFINSISIPAVIGVPREQYFKMPPKERHAVKRVPYVTPARFKESPSPRLTEHALGISLICLDIDDPELALPFYNDPGVLLPKLEPFSFLVYATASSTPDKPRIRVMVSANITRNEYRNAVNDIAKRIGLTTVTKESYVAVQPMYLPSVFIDTDVDNEHPVLFTYTDGRTYTSDDVPDYDEDILENPRPSPAADWSTPHGDELDFLRAQLPEITVEDAEEALSTLDPDMVYNSWISMAMALRHQFPRDPECTLAYQVFDSWSSKGTKYKDSNETLRQWNDIRPTTKGRVPITIRSLLHEAAKTGDYKYDKIGGKTYNAAMNFINSATDERQLAREGPERIVATPFLTPMDEDNLLRAIIQKVKALGGSVSISPLRKYMKEVRQRTIDKNKTPIGKTLPAWAKNICFLSGITRFCRPFSKALFTPEALDKNYSYKLLPKSGNDNGEGGTVEHKPVMLPQDYLLNVVKIPRAYDMRYDPTRPDDTFITEDGNRYLNTYIDNHPEPDRDAADYAGRVLVNHIKKLIQEPPYQRVVLDFLAFLVQNPGIKIRWAIFIQGAQGCGKTFLATAIEAVLGRGHVAVIDSTAVRSSWTDWAEGAQLVVVEEASVKGHNRHDVMNTLKQYISNDRISINAKFQNNRTTTNRTNYMLFTNYHDALTLAPDDRRYFILKSRIQTKGQVAAMGEDYFVNLFAMLDSHAAGLRAFLEDWEISPEFNPNGHAPVTTYQKELVADSVSDTTSAVRDTLYDSTNPLVTEDLLSSKILLMMLHTNGYRTIPGQRLAAVLREMGYRSTVDRVMLRDGDRHVLWYISKEGNALTNAELAARANLHLEDIDPEAAALL